MIQTVVIPRFPVVRASGTHYEVGLAIGRQLSSVTFNILSDNREKFQNKLPRYLEESKKYQEYAHRFFPQYMDELRGISDGSQVSFDELFLSNNREVADFTPDPDAPSHCTIIAIPTETGFILGHNEDWAASSLHELYLLDAEINGTSIFGLNYANNIIGASVAVNGYGLIEAVNELSHQDSQLGVPKNFIARALLDCKTLEETEEVLKITHRAAGFNHVLAYDSKVWNIESCAREYVIDKIHKKKYVHTNHYLTSLKHIDKGNKESETRYAKVSGLLSQVETVEDVQRVLSDKEAPRICREGTIGSVILTTFDRTAYIAYGQPSTSTYYQYKW